MRSAVIRAIGSALPNCVIANEQLAQDFPSRDMVKIGSKLGILSRRVVDGNERAIDLAERAAKALFRENPCCREKVDFLLYCTQSPEYPLPTTACILQTRLGLTMDCGALDYNLGCSGYIYGLAVAKGLIAGGVARNVLLITAETYSRYIAHDDYGNRAIFGDAASATWVSDSGAGLQVGDFVLGTDGTGAENLIVRPGCPLWMNGPEILSFTLSCAPRMVARTLERNGISDADIALWVPHQANRYLMEFLRKKLRVPAERFFYYLEDVGNTVSSSIPLALEVARTKGLWKGALLPFGFGVGYSWGAVVLRATTGAVAR